MFPHRQWQRHKQFSLVNRHGAQRIFFFFGERDWQFAHIFKDAENEKKRHAVVSRYFPDYILTLRKLVFCLQWFIPTRKKKAIRKTITLASVCISIAIILKIGLVSCMLRCNNKKFSHFNFNLAKSSNYVETYATNAYLIYITTTQKKMPRISYKTKVRNFDVSSFLLRCYMQFFRFAAKNFKIVCKDTHPSLLLVWGKLKKFQIKNCF